MSGALVPRLFQVDDMEALGLKPPAVDIAVQGLTLTCDGVVVAVGGLVRVGPHWWTFSQILPEARKAIVLHRLSLRALDAAEALGITPIYGYCDESKPRALDWILRLGFARCPERYKDDSIRVVETWCGSGAWIRET